MFTMKYYLLIIVFITLLLTWVFVYQTHGGLRFSGNTRLEVSENSIFRKILLREKNRKLPLKIYKVIPWAINLILFFIVILLYLFHIILYTFPVGIAIGIFLESSFVLFFSVTWFLLVVLYMGIIQSL